jgi:CDP-paratose 2-epimerase
MAQACSGKAQRHSYVDEARSGDHICYYSDLRKMKAHYPKWRLEHSLKDIFEQIVASWGKRLARA